jgi:hypothetical protein
MSYHSSEKYKSEVYKHAGYFCGSFAFIELVSIFKSFLLNFEVLLSLLFSLTLMISAWYCIIKWFRNRIKIKG